MLQVILVGVGGIVAMVAAGLAFRHFTHNYNSNAREKTDGNYKPNESRIREIIGSCSHCGGDVIAVNGYLLSCNHPIHYTCSTDVKRQLHGCTDPKMICKICVSGRVRSSQSRTHEGPRNRANNRSECVNCMKIITEDAFNQACGHMVHKLCWERMEETSTTCPRCMEDD